MLVVKIFFFLSIFCLVLPKPQANQPTKNLDIKLLLCAVTEASI